MAVLQGYLAGIFRAVEMDCTGGNELYELLTSGDFEAPTAMNYWTTTGSSTGATVTRTEGGGRGGYSYGAVLYEAAGAAQMWQDRYLTTGTITPTGATNYDVIASCWAKFTKASQTGSLRVFLLNTGGTVLTSGSVEMLSFHPYYGDTDWAYYSVCIDAVTGTQRVRVQVRRNMDATGYLRVDDVSCVFVQQIGGAYGAMSLTPGEWETERTTTFKSVAADGPFQRYKPTMRAPDTVPLNCFYRSDETLATPMAAGDRVFTKMITQQGTKTSFRWEFWSYPQGINFELGSGIIQKENVTLQVDGVIGVADR